MTKVILRYIKVLRLFAKDPECTLVNVATKWYGGLLKNSLITLSMKFLAGGWDGASWPYDGSIGFTYGPIEITRNGVQYYVYRTDFQGVSTTFDITFTNPGLTVGSTSGDKTVHLLRSSPDGAEYDVHFILDQM